MPTYGKENFKDSNVNYLNKDFLALKSSLINYAKSYFPNTYRDFNETSPGMMLLEMNAYVGDVLSFYIDKQYQEMLLPLAEERRNIITMAKMFGYKVKPIVPAYVELSFTGEVDAASNRSRVDYSTAGIFNPGIEVASSTNSDITFTTLEHVDFRISASNDTEIIGSTVDGLADTYTLTRKVKAISATQKTISFQIGQPEKFKNLIIPDTNVVDIISCIDSNGNNWYEVDFLAQDKIPIEVHYTDDVSRPSAYEEDSLSVQTAVPYSLSYRTSTKRFTRETNLDNTTSLVFGNGILQNGNVIDEGYLDLEQLGVSIPGQTNNLNSSIDPRNIDEYSTLGETPNNTTLTITYRVGGGINSNLPANNISSTAVSSLIPNAGNSSARLTNVTNEEKAVGGKDEEDIIEIREKAKAFFTTQNRCVTKEDFEARTLNIPSKFGNIAKVYCTKAESLNVNFEDTILEGLQSVGSSLDKIRTDLNEAVNGLETGQLDEANANIVMYDIDFYNDLIAIFNRSLNNPSRNSLEQQITDLRSIIFNGGANILPDQDFPTINLYILGYNNRKQLVGNPNSINIQQTDRLPMILKENIISYLDNFKMLSDVITIQDGYIVNFGVIFDVIAEKYADKQQVKLNCIQKIKDYFRIEKMQFNQPIFKSQLEFELMGIEGVRSIGHITITQKDDYNSDSIDANLPDATYTYSYSQGDGDIDLDGDGSPDGSFVVASGGTSDYGYKYDFQNALSDDGTIILPPNTSTPTVFELKNPNQNIQGRVR